MLIKTTRSLCPTCNSVIDAEVVEEDNKIMLHSTCPEHGKFNNLYWSDPVLYHRFDRFEEVGTGIENPQNMCSPRKLPVFLWAMQQSPFADPAGKYRSHQPLQS